MKFLKKKITKKRTGRRKRILIYKYITIYSIALHSKNLKKKVEEMYNKSSSVRNKDKFTMWVH